MHALINKAIEVFVQDTYGEETWARVVCDGALEVDRFEAMLTYDPALTGRLLAALSQVMARPRDHLLEDLGTFLVTSPTVPALRRLMRFGGVTYMDFLHSLEEFADRVQLVMDDLHLPALTLTDLGEGHFRLHCAPGLPGYGSALVGILRAMADDYGTLAMLDHVIADDQQGDTILISVVEDAHSEGRDFRLGACRA